MKCSFRIAAISAGFVRLAIHDVAPVAPHGANIEQDGFVFCLGEGERLRPHSLPLGGLVHGGSEVSRRGMDQSVGLARTHAD